MATTEELRVVITAQDQASAVFRNVGTQSTAVANAMKGVWVGVGASIGQSIQQAVGNAFKAATDAVIGFNASLEQSRVAWETMLGGAGQANAMLSQLQQFAATTPFEFPDVERAARRLTAMGFAAKDIIPLLTDIGNTAAALGVGTEGVDRITLALGQMATRTKVSAEDMLQLTEIGVPAWRILAQATGMSIAQVQDAASKGIIPAQTFINAFRNFAQSNYGGLMERQSQTFSGAVSNIKDAARIALSSAFKPLFDGIRDLTVAFANFISSEGVKGFANAINTGFRVVGAFLNLLGSSPAVMKIFEAALIGIAAALLRVLIPATIQATLALGRMIVALAIANAPLAIFAAIVAAVALVVIANWDDISKATGDLVNTISQLIGQLVEWLGQAWNQLVKDAMQAWQDLVNLTAEALNAIGQLWDDFWSMLGPGAQQAFQALGDTARDGWTIFANAAASAIRFVVDRWNDFVRIITNLDQALGGNLPMPWKSFVGKFIDPDAIRNIGDVLQGVQTKVGDFFSNIGHFFHDVLPAAIGKAIDLIKDAGGNLSDLMPKIQEILNQAAPDLVKQLADTGKDAGNALGNGILQGAKPLFEQLQRMIAQLAAGPATQALEDAEAAAAHARLIIADLSQPLARRQQAMTELINLEARELPRLRLTANEANEPVRLATRAEQQAELLNQIAQTQRELTTPINLTVNINHEDGKTDTYNELIEANGQAKVPESVTILNPRHDPFF